MVVRRAVYDGPAQEYVWVEHCATFGVDGVQPISDEFVTVKRSVWIPAFTVRSELV